MNFAQKLQKESQQWVAEGLISAEQQKQILARYPLEIAWYRQSSFLLRALSLSLVGIALILLISANWDLLPRWIRSLIALLPMLMAHAAAFWYYQKNQLKFVELSLFFANLTLGANIFLQAQIYHIDSFFPDGFFWWMVGLLIPLLWLKSRLLNYLMLLLFTNHSIILWNYDLFSPTAWIFLLVAGWVTMRNLSLPLFIFTLIALLVAVSHLAIYENKQVSLLLLFIALAMLSYYLLWLTFSQEKLPPSAKLVAELVFGGLLFLWYLPTFTELNALPLKGKISYTLIALLLSTATLSWFAAVSRTKHYCLWFFILLTLCSRLFLSYPEDSKTFGWLLNIAFVLAAIWFLQQGLQKRHKGDFFTGVALLLAITFGRYTDLVGDYLTSALIFALCGAILWLLNRFWEKRYAL